MRKQTSFSEYLNNLAESKIIDYNNPKCKECNDCCTLTASVTKKEISEIKNFLKKNKKINKKVNSNVKKTNKLLECGSIDLTCLFSDKLSKKCLVYPARPQICKSFHCHASLNKNVEAIKKEGEYIIGDIFGLGMNGLLNIIRQSIIESEGKAYFESLVQKFR